MSTKPSFIPKQLFYNPCSKPPIQHFVRSLDNSNAIALVSENLRKQHNELEKVILSIGT